MDFWVYWAKYQFMYPKWTKKNQSSCILILRDEGPLTKYYLPLFPFNLNYFENKPYFIRCVFKDSLFANYCTYPKWTKQRIAQNYVLCQWEQNTKVPKMQSPTGLHFNHHTFCQSLYCNIIIIWDSYTFTIKNRNILV